MGHGIIADRRATAEKKIGRTMWNKMFEFLPGYSQARDIFEVAWKEGRIARFEDFLLHLNKQWEGANTKKIKKLIDKIKKRDDILVDLVSSVLGSKSSISRLIIAFILSEYIEKDSIDYEDITLLIALESLLDDDFQIFKKFYKTRQETHFSGARVFVEEYESKEQSSFEKLQSLQVFGRVHIGTLASDNKNQYIQGVSTSVSDRLNMYLERVG